VLIGDPMVYYLLSQYDKDFREFFKVKVDFGTHMGWSDDTVEKYAQFIGNVSREEGLKHFDPSGVARIVEEGLRTVSDQEKLSTKFGDIVDLIRESDYWAHKHGNGLITSKDVSRAIDERIHRSDRIEELVHEMFEDKLLLIDTADEIVGQVNGLSVIPLGDYTFGRPARITARTHVGREGVVNIDREVELGGRIHNKGTMILSGYLGGKFAQNAPFALSASITFEQLYEEVDGDSASSAELYALISSLSEVPIKQGIAVTGSVNQRGQVQAIGGANEKIEGFFEICKVHGLTGDQGVLIPQSNVRNLMLKQPVVDAVEQGQFHIYAVSTIDEGIEILTGRPAGEMRVDGTFPEETVNELTRRKLHSLAESAKRFAASKVSELSNA
jgi:predicted ATP-dependent protease